MTEQILNKIREIAGSERVLVNEPMSKHTTFKVGGPADIFISIKDTKEAIDIIRLLCDYNIPYFVIGNGSNLLVKDEGYRGVIIELGKHFSSINVTGEIITADAANPCTVAQQSSWVRCREKSELVPPVHSTKASYSTCSKA